LLTEKIKGPDKGYKKFVRKAEGGARTFSEPTNSRGDICKTYKVTNYLIEFVI